VAVIATQVLGDLVNFFRGDYWRGGVGFSIASALLFYLLRPAVLPLPVRGIGFCPARGFGCPTMPGWPTDGRRPANNRTRKACAYSAGSKLAFFAFFD
jgi:hypothetical protein